MLSLKLPSEDPSQRDLRIIDEEIERIAGACKATIIAFCNQFII